VTELTVYIILFEFQGRIIKKCKYIFTVPNFTIQNTAHAHQIIEAVKKCSKLNEHISLLTEIANKTITYQTIPEEADMKHFNYKYMYRKDRWDLKYE